MSFGKEPRTTITSTATSTATSVTVFEFPLIIEGLFSTCGMFDLRIKESTAVWPTVDHGHCFHALRLSSRKYISSHRDCKSEIDG